MGDFFFGLSEEGLSDERSKKLQEILNNNLHGSFLAAAHILKVEPAGITKPTSLETKEKKEVCEFRLPSAVAKVALRFLFTEKAPKKESALLETVCTNIDKHVNNIGMSSKDVKTSSDNSKKRKIA